MNQEYETTIGLEIHAQLLTRTKIFCACPNRTGDRPNTNVCPVCLGLPGALPYLNGEAVRQAVMAALALGCRIRERSVFARKNYFYPDLPKGYQITQYGEPLAEAGSLPIETPAGRKTVRVRRLHLEEDAGKSIHDPAAGRSLVDLNRCGAALVEIVSEPDMRSPAEAVACFKALRRLLMTIGVCDGNMQEGSLRCDANVSLRKKGSAGPGTRVELKNLNSFRHLMGALEHEISRQATLLGEGGAVEQETRRWIEQEGRNAVMRRKEQEHDYRYFPDPDLPPLLLAPGLAEEIRASLPERPWEREERLRARYALPAHMAAVLCSHKMIADYFEEVVGLVGRPLMAGNFIMTHILKDIDPDGITASFPVPAAFTAQIVAMLGEGKITGNVAKTLLELSAGTAEAPASIVEREDLGRVSDEARIEALCREVLDENPGEVRRYREGRTALLKYFIGRAMAKSRGKADPALVKNILSRLLIS